MVKLTPIEGDLQLSQNNRRVESLQRPSYAGPQTHSQMKRLVCSFLVPAILWVGRTADGFAEEPPEPAKALQVAGRQPQLNAVFPMAGQPGQQLRLTVQGEFLDGVARLLPESEDLTGQVLSSSFTQAQVEVQISRDALPGQRRFRLVSEHGASNTVLFRVSRWPTPVEVEPNDDLESPMMLNFPALMSGRLETGEDVDLYRFHAKAGQRLQLTVLGARNGTPADVSLAILYPDGRELVHDEGQFVWDPYLDHTFEREGDYLAAVTLTRMPAGGQSRTDLNYQLSVGQSPFFWSVYPMGGRPGTKMDVNLRADFVEANMPLSFQRAGQPHREDGAWGLSGQVVERCASSEFRAAISIAPEAEPGVYEFSVKDESGTLAPMRFIVGDLPEVRENEPNSEQAQAQLLQLPVTVNGRLDLDGDEDWFRISLEAESTLSFSVDAEKYGSPFDSVLTLRDAQGKALASNDDARWINRPLNRDSYVAFTFKERGDYWIQLGSLYRRGGADHVYRFTVRPSQPGFLLSLNSDRPTVQRGGKGRVGITLHRLDGFLGKVSIQVSNLPQGVTAKPLTLEGDQESGSIELEASADSPLNLTDIEVVGVAKIDGSEVRRRALLPAGRLQGSGPAFVDSTPLQALLAVVEPPLFSLESAASTVYLVRGGTAEFGVRVARRPGFLSPLTLSAENLPSGVWIDGVELIDEGRMARVTLKADAQASPARVSNLAIIGSLEQGGRKVRVAAPRISLQLD